MIVPASYSPIGPNFPEVEEMDGIVTDFVNDFFGIGGFSICNNEIFVVKETLEEAIQIEPVFSYNLAVDYLIGEHDRQNIPPDQSFYLGLSLILNAPFIIGDRRYVRDGEECLKSFSFVNAARRILTNLRNRPNELNKLLLEKLKVIIKPDNFEVLVTSARYVMREIEDMIEPSPDKKKDLPLSVVKTINNEPYIDIRAYHSTVSDFYLLPDLDIIGTMKESGLEKSPFEKAVNYFNEQYRKKTGNLPDEKIANLVRTGLIIQDISPFLLAEEIRKEKVFNPKNKAKPHDSLHLFASLCAMNLLYQHGETMPTPAEYEHLRLPYTDAATQHMIDFGINQQEAEHVVGLYSTTLSKYLTGKF